ncbi:MAG: response regulator transcription factor [Ferruginibacter sp.]|nr:response regulator transcription factor [Ferruginibacter sp.]
MKILIIEDESLAAEKLQLLVKQYDPSIEILGCLESVEETVEWLNKKTHPDLLLMDIHLSDGHSFDILKKTKLQKPIIFTTAYDNYAIDAFQHLSIDYLLKPISEVAIAKALNKYKSLSSSFMPQDYSHLLESFKDGFAASSYKSRFLAKVGQRMFFIQENEVAYFAADNKIVFLIDREGNRFVINYTIEKLDIMLNPKHFFRLNRKFIVHADMIEQVKPYHNNRLKVLLKGINTTEDIIISREKISDFKSWAES